MDAPEPELVAGLRVVRTVTALRAEIDRWRQARKRVGLVPTMGALHRGHLALVTRARDVSAGVIASLFVNPAQFGPAEDFSRYPRDEEGDAAQLAAGGCDLLYAPSLAEMYPAGFAVSVDPGPIGARLDGQFRSGHFTGVATIVTKLLLQARPDVACFGEKDYQQLQIIRRVVRDLDIPVQIEPVPTVREADGLALSSRNAYLALAERAIAPQLQRTLVQVAERVRRGEAPRQAEADGVAALLDAGFASIDYVAVCDAATLDPLDRLDRPARVLAAARLGVTRLIDNIALLPGAG